MGSRSTNKGDSPVSNRFLLFQRIKISNFNALDVYFGEIFFTESTANNFICNLTHSRYWSCD